MQQSNKATEVVVPHDRFSLSMMWALEDCDHMKFSGDFLDLPDIEPTLIPTFKRKSLARLKQERALSTARLEDRTSGTLHLSNKVDEGRKRLRFQCARTFSVNTRTKLTLPLMLEVHEAEGAQPAKMDCSAYPLGSNYISASFLAGAAVLGLRRRRNRAISEPPVKQRACFHFFTKKKHVTNNDLKEKVFADERSSIAKSEQELKEAMLVPHAPRKPQPESLGKRPQIRGVPILVIPNKTRG